MTRQCGRGAAAYGLAAIFVVTFACASGNVWAKTGRSAFGLDELPSTPSRETAAPKFFTIKQVLAKLDGQTRPSSMLASASTSHIAPNISTDEFWVGPAATPPVGSEPFGQFAFRAPEGPLWTKWRAVEAQMAADEAVLARCRENQNACTREASDYLSIVKRVENASPSEKLAAANAIINASIKYMSDLEQYGVPDLWSAPLQTLKSGFGDCEDYAIAKYSVLRDAGMSPQHLQIILMRDRTVGQDHAVLAVSIENRWYILDNRWDDARQDDNVPQFKPLFAINHDGVKLFATPYAERTVHESEIDIAPAAIKSLVDDLGAHPF